MPTHTKIIKAVIPAAGFGTRMLPATKAVPKEMLPVAGKPLIQYAIEEAVASGIETIILVVRDRESLIRTHFAPARALESFLDQRGLSVTATLVRALSKIAKLQFVVQRKPLGLAHAISCARPLLGEGPFVVLLPDVIMLNAEPVTHQLMRAHQEKGGSAIAVREVQSRDVERFGIVQAAPSAGNQSGRCVRVTGLVEKPQPNCSPSRLGVFGRYLLESSIWNPIAHTSPDARGEVQLTDALNLFCRDHPLFGVRFEGRHYDAGDPFCYLKANIEVSLRDPHFKEPLQRYVLDLQEQTEDVATLRTC